MVAEEFKASSACFRSFINPATMVTYDRIGFNTLLNGIRPLRSLSLDFPTWLVDIKAAFKDAGIFNAVFLRRSPDHPTVKCQMESLAYSLVTRSINNSAIIMQIYDFNSVCDILDHISSSFKRLSSSPDYYKFVRCESAKKSFYTNNFGKGNGSDEPNWRYRPSSQFQDSSSSKGIVSSSCDKSPPFGKTRCARKSSSQTVQISPTAAPTYRKDTCECCNMKFSSRNKLFKHLNSGCTGRSFHSDEDTNFIHQNLHVQLKEDDQPARNRIPSWMYLISTFILLKVFDIPTLFDEALTINYSG